MSYCHFYVLESQDQKKLFFSAIERCKVFAVIRPCQYFQEELCLSIMLELDEPHTGISRPTYFCRIWTFFRELLTIMTYTRETRRPLNVNRLNQSANSQNGASFSVDWCEVWGFYLNISHSSYRYIYPPSEEDTWKCWSENKHLTDIKTYIWSSLLTY